jgi:hypothetical protein
MIEINPLKQKDKELIENITLFHVYFNHENWL